MRQLMPEWAVPMELGTTKVEPIVTEPRMHARVDRWGELIEEAAMSFKLPDLPYPYEALSPHMSRETLEFHHDKHHLAYVETGNKLLKGSGLEGKPLEEVVKGAFGKNAGLFNNAGQHYNHTHFWQ